MKIQIILYLTVLTFTFSCSISKPPTKSLSEYDKVSNHPEYSAVKSTIEDYINGLYDVDDRASTDSPKKITIYEINDKTAIGKIEAVWGIDYFQLAKVDNKWKIFNIIWQSYPPKN